MGGLGEEIAEKCSEAQALSRALVPGVTWVEAARGVAEWGRGRTLCAVLPREIPVQCVKQSACQGGLRGLK